MALTARIQKRYGDFLLDVDFTAEDGAALALLGASGCGKSATLKCVAGIDRPDRGRIALDGRVLFDSAAGVNLPPQQRRVGFLFQSYALFPHMTVERNVAVCLGRMDKRRRRERTAELLALLHLEDQAGLYPRQLSGGQQQRAAIGRALITRPALVLADEPTGNLDSKSSQDVMDLLLRASRHFKQTVLMITHNMNLTTSADRVFRVADGKLEELGGGQA